MAGKTPKEKAVGRALVQLNKVLNDKMDGFDVCVGLYGRGQLTYREYEQIRTAKNVPAANSELVATFHRRGPEILDILLQVLEDEEDAHSYLIRKIKEVYNPKNFEESQLPSVGASARGHPVIPVLSNENEKEFLGNGDWPLPMTTPPPVQPGLRSPIETTDYNPKMAYKMSTRPRGVAVIINNRLFTCGMKERIGTDKDADALTRLFIFLGYYTNRFDNLTGRDMHKKLKEVANLDHSKFDSLAVVFLTHGINGKLYSTDGDLIPVDDFTKYFDGVNCPLLIGKPKVFIIQACRGGKFDYGVETESTDLGESQVIEIMEKNYDNISEKALDDEEMFFDHQPTEDTDGGGGSQALPVEADFILAYATVPGYVSWRNSEYGSWFIKAFSDTMFELASTEHFLDILTEVNRRVALDFQSKGRNKQIPSPVTMLTRKLYFRPGLYS